MRAVSITPSSRGCRIATAVLVPLVAVGVAVHASAQPQPDGATGRSAAVEPVVVALDLPMRGRAARVSADAVAAVRFHLRRIGGKVGDRPVTLRTYDNATAAAGRWTVEACRRNARLHARRTDEVAVVGPYNSGCAKEQVPILNRAAGGPLVMVTHAATDPGLTTQGWAEGEPARFRPSRLRSFARVVSPDDAQARAAVRVAGRNLRRGRCLVLDDGSVYGRGLAATFVQEARTRSHRVTVVRRATWSGRSANYLRLFRAARASRPNCVYVGGVADQNGVRLLRDKVAVLGDNARVTVLAADGFTGWPEIQRAPAAQGIHATFPGEDVVTITALRGGGGKAFVTAYRRATGKDLVSSHSLYAVAATQVVLAAVAASDGTRAGVRAAILGGKGVRIPLRTSVVSRELALDPKVGDPRLRVVTLLRVVRQREVRQRSVAF